MSLTAMAATTYRAGHPGHAEAVAFSPTGLLIDGAFVPAAGRRVLGVEDPATGRTLASVADAAPLDCMAALEAAVAAQGPWAATAPRDRSRVLRRASDRLREEAETLALVITSESGKPIAESLSLIHI